MRYRTLGNTGLNVSVVGLGTNQFGGKVDEAGTAAIVHRALDLGINFIDTANTYTKGGSEKAIGKAIAGRREEVILATKVGMKTGDGPNDLGASRWSIFRNVEASLKRLNTDYIDLYQIHRFDPTTPAEETMSALADLVRSGKVRYIGASNYAAWQLCHANSVAERWGWPKFVTIQPHYHMFERSIEAELIPYCQAFNVGVIPYFPLAGGFLTGKYRRGQAPPKGSRGESNPYVQKFFTDRYFTIIERLEAFAKERDHTLAELAIAWLIAKEPVCSVISGATSPGQVEENARAGTWELSAEEVEAIDAILDSPEE